jgi:hypothetical protein
MRYEEIEDLATEYIPAGKKRYFTPEHIDPVAERKWVSEMTKQLQLEKFLTAIKDDVWQTGAITPIIMPWNHKYSIPAQGFMLYSDPYNMVTFSGNGRNTEAQVHQEEAALSIFVTGRNEEYDRMVHILDSNIYKLTDFRHPIYKSIQFFGIEHGFRKSFTLPKIANTRAQLDPDNLPAIAHTIQTAVNIRDRNMSLPEDLYQFSRSIEEQVPELIEKGSFSASELRNWAYANQGTPWVIRQLDRVLPKLIQL